MPAPRELPRSLVAPDGATAALRRARAGVLSADANPATAAQGFETRGCRWLHIMVQLPDVGSSIDWELWLFDRASQLWGLDTRLGVNGTTSLTAGAADNPQINLIEIGRAERVFIKIDNLGGFGVGAAGANVWLSGVSDQA